MNLRTVEQETTWRLCGAPSHCTARDYLEVVCYHEPSNYTNNVTMGGCVVS
jgi:hypothetical protein